MVNKLLFLVFHKDILIGHSRLEYGDPPMSVAHGKFLPSVNFTEIRHSFEPIEDKDQRKWEGGFRVSTNNGENLECDVPISIIEYGDVTNPIDIEVVCHAIIKPPYSELFPHHVAAYENSFLDNNDSSAEFTDAEIHFGVKLFTIIYFFSIILLMLAIVAGIYFGYKGVTWYLVIPAWAICNFGLRVFKRYFRNILESFKDDLAVLETEKPANENINLAIVNSSEQKSKNIARSTPLIVAIAMLAVSTLWYGVGVILTLLI